VNEGKVTLQGTVNERSMKHAIEDLVDRCPGVKDIDNRVRVARAGEHGGSAFEPDSGRATEEASRGGRSGAGATGGSSDKH
jgi:osmotically-inducible protein OsmY